MVQHQKSMNNSIIGSTELIEVAGIKKVPAKVDTGADTSAIWASNIDMEKDGTLVFCLFGPKSSFYTGELLKTSDYLVRTVRSSHGDVQIRYDRSVQQVSAESPRPLSAILVFDLQGRMVTSVKENGSRLQLSLTTLPKGIYVVKAQGAGIGKSIKIIK